MSQLIRLEGKHSTQNAHCALAYTKSTTKSLQKSHISPRRVHGLEKNTTPLVLAVLTNISYGFHIV